jgi:hypothetical protein
MGLGAPAPHVDSTCGGFDFSPAIRVKISPLLLKTVNHPCVARAPLFHKLVIDNFGNDA